MVDESTPLNKMMGDIPNLDATQANTTVDAAICQGYEGLIEVYGETETSVQVKAHKKPGM